MVFSNRFNRLAGSVIACGCAMLFTAAEPTEAQGGGLADEASFAVVRVDLQAGAFLDPLPFDIPFLVVGWVPASTQAVEIEIEEYLEVPVALNEQELRQFESELRAYLATLAQSSTEPGTSSIHALSLRHKANELLVDQVQTGGGALRPLRQIWHYATPWNWENWGELFRDKIEVVVAPGTVFDLDEGRRARVMDADDADLTTASSLAEYLVQEARTAQVATFSPSRVSRLPVRWNRLIEEDLSGGSKKGARVESAGNWNQLERIRGLSGNEEENPFSGTGRVQQSRGGEWRSFRVLIEPLEAERYYRFDFELKRKLTQAEVDAFVAGARRRADGVLEEAGRGTLLSSDGQRLRSALRQSLHGVVDRGDLKSPGGVFDGNASYESVHAEMVGLSEAWGDGEGDEKVTDLVEGRLADMVRQQSLVNETGVGASTADNDYVSADIGMLYAASIGKTVAYVGVNFYLRPVNKSVPLRQKGGLRRFAFTAGMTLNSIEDRRGIRSDLYFNQALVLGAGYRLSQYWRLSGGGLVFRERDPDSYPLTNKKRTAVTPYVALAFDVDAGRHLKGIGGLFDFLKGGR
ncbi:MAG: hypothetical protein ACI906_003151 [Candidatus Latescibacterota bacterium]|jgi:hypothetical protein